MTARSLGRVRELPFDSPGLPPCLPMDSGGHYADQECPARVPRGEVPDDPYMAAHPMVSSYYCTRLAHDPDEPHVCHLREIGTGVPVKAIVWGGE